MLEQLNEIIRQFGQSAVVDNADVPNEHNDAVMQEAQSSIMNGLQGMVANGQISQLTDMLNSGGSLDQNNPAVQGMANNFLGGITEKFGISKETATKIAMSLIPMVLAQFSKKAGDPNDNSLNITDILGSLTGGGSGSGDFGSVLSNIGKSIFGK